MPMYTTDECRAQFYTDEECIKRLFPAKQQLAMILSPVSSRAHSDVYMLLVGTQIFYAKLEMLFERTERIIR